MFEMLAIVGGLFLTSLSFIFGRFYAESERIMSEKRKSYLEFLSVLPPLQDVYDDTTEEEFLSTMRPAIERTPSLIFYADNSVMMAWRVLQQRYFEAHASLTPQSDACAPEYLTLAKAQNDIILEMRRDAFRWSIFNYNGKSRVQKTGVS